MDDSMIRVVNDRVSAGRFGEKVLWGHLVDGLDCEYADYESTGAACWDSLRDRCHALPPIKLGIQNATWAKPNTAGKAPYVAVLQDNIHRMWNDRVPQCATLSVAKKIVANGALIAKDYEEYDFPNGKIVVIPLGIDEDFWRAPQRDSLSGRKPRVVFVGDNGAHKGWDHVVDLATSRRDVDWRFVCKSGGRNASHLGRVDIQVDREGVRDALAWADLFVLASPVESQCLAALEAMACGLPVVMPATGVFYDWRPSSYAEVALPGSMSHFSAAIDRGLGLIDKVDPRADLLAAGRFTIASMISSWRKLVAELLDAE